MNFDLFTLLLGVLAGGALYAIAIRFIPGTQPGEAELNKLAGQLSAHAAELKTAVTDHAKAAQQQAVAMITRSGVRTAEVVSAQIAAVATKPPDPPKAPEAQKAPEPPVLTDVVAPGDNAAWPQVVEVDGVHMLADAPINPAFKLDATTKAYDNAHSYLFDPSNGSKCNPPQPTRSPAGFPLFYAIGANNAPVGEPRVLYNGQTFADDAAVASYITALATAHAADDVSAAAAAAQTFAGPVPVSALTKDDLRFLWWADANPATPKLHNWAYTVLSGSRREIQVALASVSEDISWLRSYDATKYQGVLRSYYDAAPKA